MICLVIVVEKVFDWGFYYLFVDVMSVMDYLCELIGIDDECIYVINLCCSYKYLGIGYYVLLLVEVCGYCVMFLVCIINDLCWCLLYGLDIDDFNSKFIYFLLVGGCDIIDFGILVYFGEIVYFVLQDFLCQVFEMFFCLLLCIEFECECVWQVVLIKLVGLYMLDDVQEDVFVIELDCFFKKFWCKLCVCKCYCYDIVMLVDLNEVMLLLNKKVLKFFVDVGKEFGIEVDLIGKNDYQWLVEYDGLFICEIIVSDNYIYCFVYCVEKEGMVVIDDFVLILCCINKIFFNDLMVLCKLVVLCIEIFYCENIKGLKEIGEKFGFLIVLKILDGLFLCGVVKVEDVVVLEKVVGELFQYSVLLLVQEFLYIEFDWCIGVFNCELLYVCKYYMLCGYWQIYNYGVKGIVKFGGFEMILVCDVLSEVVKFVLKVINVVGDGFYGVDFKQVNGKLVVIEVNDNLLIDVGVEDVYLGEDLYLCVMQEFLCWMEYKWFGIGC